MPVEFVDTFLNGREVTRVIRQIFRCRARHKVIREQAIELLTAALELNPGDVKVLVLRASAKRQQGTDESFEMALEDLADAAALYSLNQKQVHQAEGADVSDSGLEVLEHPEITRQRTLTWNDMAVRYFKRHEYDQAITLFIRLLARLRGSEEKDGGGGKEDKEERESHCTTRLCTLISTESVFVSHTPC